jgi:hypothetical protein
MTLVRDAEAAGESAIVSADRQPPAATITLTTCGLPR